MMIARVVLADSTLSLLCYFDFQVVVCTSSHPFATVAVQNHEATVLVIIFVLNNDEPAVGMQADLINLVEFYLFDFYEFQLITI